MYIKFIYKSFNNFLQVVILFIYKSFNIDNGNLIQVNHCLFTSFLTYIMLISYRLFIYKSFNKSFNIYNVNFLQVVYLQVF